jgi:hypothetical protein
MNTNVKQRYQSTVEVYGRWCRDELGGADPAARETFAFYLENLVEESHTDKSVAHVVRVIGRAHPSAVHADDVAAAMTAAKARKRAANIRDLKKVLARMTSGSIEDVRDRAVLLLGTLGDLTAGELADLEVGHVAFDEHLVELELHYYKKGNRPVSIDNEMGLVQALQEWVDLAGITHGYIFRALDSEGRPTDRGLNQSGIDHIRRFRCQTVGVDPMEVRGRPTRKSTRANFSTQEVLDLYEVWEEAEHRNDVLTRENASLAARCQELEAQCMAAAQIIKAAEMARQALSCLG